VLTFSISNFFYFILIYQRKSFIPFFKKIVCVFICWKDKFVSYFFMFIKDQYFHYFLYLSKKKLSFLYVSITNTCSLFVCFFFLDLPMANTTPIFFYIFMNDIFIVFFFISDKYLTQMYIKSYYRLYSFLPLLSFSNSNRHIFLLLLFRPISELFFLMINICLISDIIRPISVTKTQDKYLSLILSIISELFFLLS